MSRQPHLSSDVIDLALGAVPQPVVEKVDSDGCPPVLVRLRRSIPASLPDAPREAWCRSYTTKRAGDGNADEDRMLEGRARESAWR